MFEKILNDFVVQLKMQGLEGPVEIVFSKYTFRRIVFEVFPRVLPPPLEVPDDEIVMNNSYGCVVIKKQVEELKDGS